MDKIVKFYSDLAPHYDKLFLDWKNSTVEQANVLDGIIKKYGFSKSAKVLDSACGIGTQAVGLARLGYGVTASDICLNAIDEAKLRAQNEGLEIDFKVADFRELSSVFSECFDVILSMDNALPHMLTATELEKAINSIINRLNDGGIFIASIRDYDEILKTKPPYSQPYIHKTKTERKISFQTWEWSDRNYKLTQYIIDDGSTLNIHKFECEYRCFLRAELDSLLKKFGCSEVTWLFPNETGFYQPIVVAKK